MRGKDEWDSFISPGDTLFGQFRCAMCGSVDLHFDVDPKDNIFRITCESCGNCMQVNWVVDNGD